MKIIFIASSRIPTERAMGTAIMKQCEAFSSAQNEVTLLVPRRRHAITEDPFVYHRVIQNFTIREVWCLELQSRSRIAYYLRQFTFLCALTVELVGMPNESCLYGREPELIALIPTRKKKFIELHHLYGLSRFGKTLLKQFGGIITLTHALKNDVTSRYVYPAERIQVVPSGVNLKEFEKPESRVNSRTRLELSAHAKIALYIGSLEAWKGIGTFLDASHALLDTGILSVVIGGTDEQIAPLKVKYPDVLFLGHHPQSELPHNQQAADVLVVPNTAKEEISARHTSPLKVFAHMASGVPIVASATEALCEVLSVKNATLVPPDDPRALAEGIQRVFEDTHHSATIAEQAKEDVIKYDWNSRTASIITFINESSPKTDK